MIKVTFDFLKGFSARGCQVHMASRSIFMTSSNTVLLRDIFTFLVREKYHVSWSNLGDRSGIRISGEQSLRRWKSEIGFSTREKAEQLETLLGLYEH